MDPISIWGGTLDLSSPGNPFTPDDTPAGDDAATDWKGIISSVGGAAVGVIGALRRPTASGPTTPTGPTIAPQLYIGLGAIGGAVAWESNRLAGAALGALGGFFLARFV